MDKRLFMPAVMNLRADIEAKAQPAGRSRTILRRAV
jgi:hypothetical protein